MTGERTTAVNMAEERAYPENFIKYLGTGGGRFSMIKQIRSTGGLWVRYGGVRFVVDPGPGSLVRICGAKPTLSSEDIDVIILTHKHIDHSGDANVLIECMTRGGFDERGMLVAPADAIGGSDPVILKYSKSRLPKIASPEDGSVAELGNGVTAEAARHVHHKVDCFGYIFRRAGLPTWGIISDTKMQDSFKERYKDCEFISINATFPNPKSRLDHISVDEAVEFAESVRPKLAVLTHLGAMMTTPGGDGERFLKNLASARVRVEAATDGMVVDLDAFRITRGE